MLYELTREEYEKLVVGICPEMLEAAWMLEGVHRNGDYAQITKVNGVLDRGDTSHEMLLTTAKVTGSSYQVIRDTFAFGIITGLVLAKLIGQSNGVDELEKLYRKGEKDVG